MRLEHRGTTTFAILDDGREILHSYKICEADTVEVYSLEWKLFSGEDADLVMFED